MQHEKEPFIGANASRTRTKEKADQSSEHGRQQPTKTEKI
jgi:hypothetical protein